MTDTLDTRNVADTERLASVAMGAALVTWGCRRRDAGGFAAALAGAALALRGATGSCPLYRALGVSTGSADAVLGGGRTDTTGRAATVNARKATRVEGTVTIDRPRQELYEFWKDFENLPRFMQTLTSVTVHRDGRSHWVARAPLGTEAEWDAEIVNDVPGEIIAWKTIGQPDVASAGAVNFRDHPAGRGTVVRVEIDVEPPGGAVAGLIARLFGDDPGRALRDDLRRFKQLMEAGTGA